MYAVFSISLLPGPTCADGRGANDASGPARSYSDGDRSLVFEPNAGQVDPSVKFLSRGPGYTVFLADGEMVLGVGTPTKPGTTIRMKLLGAARASFVSGVGLLSGKVHYLIGSRRHGWRTNIPTYDRVKFDAVYPGVDLVYYGNQRELEYDFIVAPGADPKAIALAFEGQEALEVDSGGDLLLRVAGGGEVRFRKPVVYQVVNGQPTHVAASYRVDHDHRVGFQVAAYDTTRPLVIDPALGYAALLGGSKNDTATSIAVDGSGHAYVAGQTESADFVGRINTFKGGSKNNGTTDAFVAKLAPDGTREWVTYLGGADADAAYGIAIAPGCLADCHAFVTGDTFSADLPVSGGAFSTKISGNSDAFVAKLTPTGSSLVYSTYLGGGGSDAAYAIAVDGAGNAYVGGETRSSNFPFIAGPFASSKGKLDAFLAKLNASGSTLLYSTYFGGTGDDVVYAVALSCPFPSDASKPCDAYVTGQTSSNNLPTAAPAPAAPYDASFNGSTDAFVAKMNTAGTGLGSLTYSTYLGGSGADAGLGIALFCQPADPTSCNVFVTGQTSSANFPIVPNPRTFGGARRGATDAFVTQVGPTGSTLVYSLFLGGSDDETGYGIAVDNNGRALLTGQTESLDFPTTTLADGTYDVSPNGGADAFVTRLKIDGSGLFNSTYLGGSANDAGLAVAFACIGPADCSAYVAGQTLSANFPGAPSIFNASGLADAFVVKLDLRVNTTITLISAPNPSAIGQPVTFTATVTNPAGGTPTGTVTFKDGTTVLGSQSLGAAGAATLITSSLALGTHSITAEYGGDPDFNGSVSAALTHLVTAVATTTTISAPTVSYDANASVTVMVTSSAGTPIGSVALSVDGGAPITQALVNGSTIFTLTSPAAGDHDLSATYPGQGNDFGASSATGTLHVNPAGTTTTITAPTVTFNANASVTVKVTSPVGTPTGNVTLSVDAAVPITQALVGGSAVFTLTSPAAGDHSLVASYAAQGNFAASSATASLHVDPARPVLTVPGPQTVNEGQLLTFQVNATDADTPVLSFSATNLPLGAGFNAATRTFSWTPTAAQGGSSAYIVYFTASDGQASDTESVQITVNDTLADRDLDGIPDALDNCPDQYNPDQFDVCHNSPEAVTAQSVLTPSGNATGPLITTVTVTFSGGTDGVCVVPVNLFNAICRVIDNATGQPIEQGTVPEGPPINLTPYNTPNGVPNGNLFCLAPNATQDFTVTFDLRLFYPNLVEGSFTVQCDYVNFAHIPPQLAEPDDPKIWKGVASTPRQGIYVGTLTFGGFNSPVPNEPFKQGRAIPVKFSVTDSAGNLVTTLAPRLFVQQLDDAGNPVGSLIPATSTGGETSNVFRFNGGAGQYIYNLNTRPLTVGRWRLSVFLDDGRVPNVDVRLTP